MTNNDLLFLSLIDLARRIKAGDLSPVELTEAYLGSIEQLNEKLKIYITVTQDQARSAARKAEDEIRQGTSHGPLHGIPYACKDIFLTRGVRTTGGSRVLEDWVPDYDAAVNERLTAAGAILLGKTNMYEFCHGSTGENSYYGTVKNPWDSTRLAGGSSSGSAAAVAQGLAPAALGSDVGGSVRVPAALCGVVGLKPTYGRISCYGAIPYAWSMDHVGCFTRTVKDAAIMLETLAGYDSRDPASVNAAVPSYTEELRSNVQGMRIGVPQTFYFDHVDPEIVDAVQGALRSLEYLGARIVEMEIPPMEYSRTVSLVIQMSEALSYHSRYLPSKGHLYGADFRSGLAFGQFVLAEHYVRARRMVQRYRRQMAAVFEAIDVIATPTCPIVASPVGTVQVTTEGKVEVVGNALTRLTSFFGMTGHPALTLPCGLHSTGLPMGIQIIGPFFEESTVLRVAQAIETCLDLTLRPPSKSGH